MPTRRAFLAASSGLALGSQGARTAPQGKCRAPRIIVLDNQDREIDPFAAVVDGNVQAEFSVTPRERRWQRGHIRIRNSGDPSWDGAVGGAALLLDAAMKRQSIGFASGGPGSMRDGEIVVTHDPELPRQNILGWTWFWVREADPETIVAAKVVMGIAPDDPLFGEVILHELGHAVGLQHENRLDGFGNPVAIMHPFAITGFSDYQADDLAGMARLRYRGGDRRNRRRRRKTRNRR